jgi:uncharacterized membrane protein
MSICPKIDEHLSKNRWASIQKWMGICIRIEFLEVFISIILK